MRHEQQITTNTTTAPGRKLVIPATPSEPAPPGFFDLYSALVGTPLFNKLQRYHETLTLFRFALHDTGFVETIHVLEDVEEGLLQVQEEITALLLANGIEGKKG